MSSRRTRVPDILLATVLVALAGGTALRIARTVSFVDYLHYKAIAEAMVDGKDLYDFVGDHITDFPPYGVFFAPFLLLHWEIQEVLFLVINLAAAAALMGMVLRRGPEWLLALIGIVLLNSAPMMQALRQGQVSILVSFLLILVLLEGRLRARPFFLGTAMMLKYSFGLFALLALVKRGPLLCALAFVIFLLWMASPAILGADLLQAYRDHVASLQRAFGPEGINNPGIHGSNLVHLHFFRPHVINTIGKILGTGIFGLILWRERKSEAIRLPLLLVTGSLGMAVAYHRLYDLVIVLPVLAALAVDFWKDRRWIHLGCSSGFLLLFLVPQSRINQISAALGEMARGMPGVVLGMDVKTPGVHFFPVYGVVILLLSAYSLLLYFRPPEAA